MKCETCGQPLIEKPSTLHQTYGSIPAVLFECAVAENFDGHSHYRRWVRKDAPGVVDSVNHGDAAWSL